MRRTRAERFLCGASRECGVLGDEAKLISQQGSAVVPGAKLRRVFARVSRNPFLLESSSLDFLQEKGWTAGEVRWVYGHHASLLRTPRYIERFRWTTRTSPMGLGFKNNKKKELNISKTKVPEKKYKLFPICFANGISPVGNTTRDIYWALLLLRRHRFSFLHV